MIDETLNLNSFSEKPATWWHDPFLWVFICLVGIGSVVSSIESAGWLSSLLFIPAIILAVIVVLYLSRKLTPLPIEIHRPALECWIVLGWYCIFMLLSTLAKGEGILADEFGKWLWFIIIPILLVFILRGRSSNFREVLQSIGFRSHGLGKALFLGFLAYVAMVPVIPFIIPESQLLELQELFQEPLELLTLLPLSFLLSLVTAGFTEEIFFRGIIQSRLAKLMGSEMHSCLITAFLFGIYHLPYAYFLTSWPTHGNMLWAVSSVLAEQMVAGLLLGVLWLRTHNIAAPILFHALVNTAAIMTSINIQFG